MAVPTISRLNNEEIQNTTVHAPLSQKQIEGLVSSIDANQIESIAQKLVESILKIDEEKNSHMQAIGGIVKADCNNETSERIDLKPLLLPLVKTELEQAFATPRKIVGNPIWFHLIDDFKPIGILTKIADQLDLTQSRLLIAFSLSLTVDMEATRAKEDLCFHLDVFKRCIDPNQDWKYQFGTEIRRAPVRSNMLEQGVKEYYGEFATPSFQCFYLKDLK